LDHEVSDDSVKFGVVEVSSPAQFREVFARLRRMFPIQLDNKFTHPAKQKKIIKQPTKKLILNYSAEMFSTHAFKIMAEFWTSSTYVVSTTQ